MLLRQLLDIFDLLDRPDANGGSVKQYFESVGGCTAEVTRVENVEGHTDMVRVTVPGANGKLSGGKAPTLGILGRLGGVGARPTQTGFVSDGDGALAALTAAAKLADMRTKGDCLEGDVIICTHICPAAPVIPHDPVPFMGSFADVETVNRLEVGPDMDAILSIDTTKGNRLINKNGFAISPTVKEGYILRVSEDLLSLMEQTTGSLPQTFPVTTQDITPYGNGVFHLNSIMQPAVATTAPVVGVAVTTEVPVAGPATGACHATDVEAAARFAVEVAKAFGKGKCAFYNREEFALLKRMYGDFSVLQTKGGQI